MPNSVSSELGRVGLEALTSGRVDLLARSLNVAPGDKPPDDARLKKVARDFAAVFYSMAFKEMEQTTRLPGLGGEEGDDQSPVQQGAQDFLSMFLPRAVAGDGSDPLARYIYDSLKQHYGDALDEKA